MPEMHLKQPGLTYSSCGPFTRNKERIEKLDKACFQHDMAYGKSKYLTKRAQSDKVLRDKAFKIASDTKFDGYQRGLASMVHKFFIESLVRVALLLSQITNSQINFIGRLLRKLRDEKFIHHLETISGLLI